MNIEGNSLSARYERFMKSYEGYLYILPLLSFLIVFILFGILYNIYLSFFEWNGIGAKRFIGIENYSTMFQDAGFKRAMIQTFKFMIISIPGSMILGLIFASLLHGATLGANLFKSIFFIPYVIAIVTIGVTFKGIYEPNFGLLNETLRMIGLGSLEQVWLGDPKFALYAIMASYIFSHVGFYMLIYFTSLLNIDQEIFEAARIDGAGVFKQFKSIIIPLMAGTHITLLILGVIAALKVFDIVWIMTEGGPGGATDLMSTFLFRKALLDYQTGYSSAISVILLLIAFVYTVFQLKIYKKIRR